MEDVRTHSAKFVRVPEKWFPKVYAKQRLTFQEHTRWAKTDSTGVVVQVLAKGRLTKSAQSTGRTTGIGTTILKVQYEDSAIQPQDGDCDGIDLEELIAFGWT